jgi:hypothetical protein
MAATLSYFFKFEEGYDLTAGGKMPGFCSEGMACILIEQSCKLPFHRTFFAHNGPGIEQGW